MSEYIVLDASFALKLIFPERFSQEAHALLREWLDANKTILVPALLPIEAASKFAEKVAQNRLTAQYARQQLDEFLALFPNVIHDEAGTLSARAFEIAVKLGHRNAYDAHYVALLEVACENGACELWTADRGLWETASQEDYSVRFLGQ